MLDIEPPDDMHLLRLIWSPDDVIDGQVQPAAFKKNDLRSIDRYVSVDRVDMLVPAVVRRTAADQQAKANPENNVRREEAYSTRLVAGAIRAILDDQGNAPLIVRPEPILDPHPEINNPAHCMVANNSGRASKGYLLKLQTTLADLTFDTKHLEEALSEYE